MSAPRALRAAWHALPFRAPLMRAVRGSGMPLPERAWRHLHFTGPMSVVPAPGVRFMMRHHGHSVENDLFWRGYGNGWEATSLRLWSRLAKEARTVLDIGANTGVYALAAKAVNPAARVVAFEPVPRIHAKLAANVAANDFAIEAVRAGVSDRVGMMTLYDLAGGHAYSASFERSMLKGRSDVVETTANVVRADAFLENAAAPVLAKIDTERHEPAVLDGFGKALARLRPTLLVEILDRDLGAEVARRLEGLDYIAFEIEEGVALKPAPALGSASRNHLLMPREEAVRLGLADGRAHSQL